MASNGMRKSIFHYSLGNVFVRSLSFILLPLYSRFLSPSEYGDYSVILALYSVIQVFFQFGLQTALNKFYIAATSEVEKREVFSSIVLLISGMGLIITGICIVSAPSISMLIFAHENYSIILQIVFIALFFETVAGTFIFLLIAKEQSGKSVLITSIAAVGNLIGNIVLVYHFRMGISGIIIAQLIANLLFFTLSVFILRDAFVFRFNTSFVRRLIVFAFPLVIANLCTAGSNIADRFILKSVSGSEEVGLYSFSYRIAMIAGIYIIAFTNAWTPRALHLLRKNGNAIAFGHTFNKLLGYGFLLILSVFTVVSVLFTDSFLGFSIMNPSYQTGVIILLPVMSAYLLKGIAAYYEVQVTFAGTSRFILISDALAFCINVIVNILFIPVFGMLAAAYATLFAFGSSALFLFLLVREKMQIEYRKSELLQIIILFAVCISIGLICNSFYTYLIMLVIYFVFLQFFTAIRLFPLSKSV